MIESFGIVNNANKLGDYCRHCLDNNIDRTYLPEVANDTWEIYKCLRLTDELIAIFSELEIFSKFAQSGYRLREEPHIIRWTYDRNNHGAADHYHHDGHFNKGGQISLMLLLEQNIGMTHMRLVPDSHSSLGRNLYDLLWKHSFPGRGRLFKLNDWFIERTNSVIRLEGPRDRLYFFNAGDNLHKAFPVVDTTRTIFHLNLTLFESRLTKKHLADIDTSALSTEWKQLLNINTQ
jgi:hypothetical protein